MFSKCHTTRQMSKTIVISVHGDSEKPTQIQNIKYFITFFSRRSKLHRCFEFMFEVMLNVE